MCKKCKEEDMDMKKLKGNVGENLCGDGFSYAVYTAAKTPYVKPFDEATDKPEFYKFGM